MPSDCYPCTTQYFDELSQFIESEVKPETVPPTSPVEFELEPYLAAVEFYIFPSHKGLTLNVRRPDGKVVEPGKDADTPPVKHLSTFDLLVVHDPEPGRWRYEVVGGAGAVEVLRNPIPLRMQLISPASVHPQGKPMRLKPQEAFTNHPDHLVIAQVVDSPEEQCGEAVWLSLAKKADTPGQFIGSVPTPAREEGHYLLAVKLAPEETEKQAVADQTVLEVTMQYPPTPGWQKALWILLGIAGAGVIALTL